MSHVADAYTNWTRMPIGACSKAFEREFSIACFGLDYYPFKTLQQSRQ